MLPAKRAVSFPSMIWFHPSFAKAVDPSGGEAGRSDAPTGARSPVCDHWSPFSMEGVLDELNAGSRVRIGVFCLGGPGKIGSGTVSCISPKTGGGYGSCLGTNVPQRSLTGADDKMIQIMLRPDLRPEL